MKWNEKTAKGPDSSHFWTERREIDRKKPQINVVLHGQEKKKGNGWVGCMRGRVCDSQQIFCSLTALYLSLPLSSPLKALYTSVLPVCNTVQTERDDSPAQPNKLDLFLGDAQCPWCQSEKKFYFISRLLFFTSSVFPSFLPLVPRSSDPTKSHSQQEESKWEKKVGGTIFQSVVIFLSPIHQSKSFEKEQTIKSKELCSMRMMVLMTILSLRCGHGSCSFPGTLLTIGTGSLVRWKEQRLFFIFFVHMSTLFRSRICWSCAYFLLQLPNLVPPTRRTIERGGVEKERRKKKQRHGSRWCWC